MMNELWKVYEIKNSFINKCDYCLNYKDERDDDVDGLRNKITTIKVSWRWNLI